MSASLKGSVGYIGTVGKHRASSSCYLRVAQVRFLVSLNLLIAYIYFQGSTACTVPEAIFDVPTKGLAVIGGMKHILAGTWSTYHDELEHTSSTRFFGYLDAHFCDSINLVANSFR